MSHRWSWGYWAIVALLVVATCCRAPATPRSRRPRSWQAREPEARSPACLRRTCRRRPARRRGRPGSQGLRAGRRRRPRPSRRGCARTGATRISRRPVARAPVGGTIVTARSSCASTKASRSPRLKESAISEWISSGLFAGIRDLSCAWFDHCSSVHRRAASANPRILVFGRIKRLPAASALRAHQISNQRQFGKHQACTQKPCAL